MHTLSTVMKQIFPSVTLCLAALLCYGSASMSAKGVKDEVKNHFMKVLRQDVPSPIPTTIERTLKSKDIDKYKTLVWQAWQEANAQTVEEKLIPLRSLCPKNKGAWHLPEQLEPSATMPYYWGIKWKALTTEEIQKNYQAGFLGDDSSTTDERIGASKPFPMYLYLHGSGPKDDEWKFSLMWTQYFDDAASVYFVPQIPNEGQYYRWWQQSKQYAWEKLIRLALAGGDIDANRMYVLGVSEGGYGSQRLASFYADYWAAAGPMAGGEPLKNAPVENCANIGFSLLTGALDEGFYRNRLTGYTIAAFDSVQQVWARKQTTVTDSATPLFRHRTQLVPNCQHSIDYSPTTPWLKTFVRNPYPKTVLWEDFPMDGRHRRGFYNLVVLSRPTERTYYEMTISGNTVNLTVSDVDYETVEKDPNWGIDLKFHRHYRPSTHGKWRLYLNDTLVDLQHPVTIIVNGKKAFEGKVTPRLQDMIDSCQEFFDPYRIYPASVEVAI